MQGIVQHVLYIHTYIRTVHTLYVWDTAQHTYMSICALYKTIGSTPACCHNQVRVATTALCTETSETMSNMCVVKRVMLYQLTL